MAKFKILGDSTIFSDKDFVKLWLSQVLSMPASHMLNFILAIRVFEISGSNFIVSLLVALITIPPILFSSVAGVLADSLNRKVILIVSNLLRAVVVAGLIFFGDSYHAMLVVAFLIAFISVFFGPAESASIPALTKRENLLMANTLFLFTLYAGFLLGYSLAGPLLVWFGDDVYFVLILAFLLATFVDTLLPPIRNIVIQKEEIKNDVKKGLRSMVEKLKEGLAYIKHEPLLLMAMLQITFVFSIERGVVGLVPDFALNFLHITVGQIGYFLIAPIGLGAMTGALLVNRYKHKVSKRKLINAGILVDAITLSLLPLYGLMEKHASDFGFSENYFWMMIFYVMVLMFLSGVADVAIIVSAQTMLQEESQSEKRGRVFGNLTMIMNLVGLPVILIVGWLATLYPVGRIIQVFGLMTLVMGITSVIVNKKKIDPLLQK
ncbi:MAG: MFS transporter [Patescibacteria group bacterium]|jgi:MFS family permease